MNYQEAVQEYAEIKDLYLKEKEEGQRFEGFTVGMYNSYINHREMGLQYITGGMLKELQNIYSESDILEMDVPYFEKIASQDTKDLLKIVRKWDEHFEQNIDIVSNYIDIFGEYDQRLFNLNITQRLLKMNLNESAKDIVEQFILSGIEFTNEELEPIAAFLTGNSYIGETLKEYLLSENKLDMLVRFLNNRLIDYSTYYDDFIVNKIKHGYFKEDVSVVEQCFSKKQWPAILWVAENNKQKVFFNMFKGKNKKLTSIVCDFITENPDNVLYSYFFNVVQLIAEANIRKENIIYTLQNCNEVYSFLEKNNKFEVLSQDDELTLLRLNGIEEYQKYLLAEKYGVEFGPKAKRAPFDVKTKCFEIGVGNNKRTIDENSPYYIDLIYAMGEAFDKETYKYNYQQWMQKYLEIRDYDLYKELQEGNAQLLSAAFKYADDLETYEGTLKERINQHCIHSENGLKYLLNLSDEFVEKNHERLVMLSVNGGYEIVETLYNQYESELRENLVKIVKAAISSEEIFKQFKYGNLENELQMQLSKNVKKVWETNQNVLKSIELSGKKTQVEILECDDFMNVIEIGRRPQRTCQSWLDGSHNESLLSNFDGNKKVLYAINSSGETIARSIIRLAKIKDPGTVVSNNRLQFVDVAEEKAEDATAQMDLFAAPIEREVEANEELAIFLERTYSPYNERDGLLECFAEYVKEKAEKMGAVALVFESVNDSEEIVKDFYITETQNGIQYLDSFAGARYNYGYQLNQTLNKL